MAWVTKGWGTPLAIIPHQTDLNCFRAVKTRQPTSCCVCGNKQPKGSWVYGSEWIRICLACQEKFSREAIAKFQDVINYIKRHQGIYKEHKKKWKVENTLAKL